MKAQINIFGNSWRLRRRYGPIFHGKVWEVQNCGLIIERKSCKIAPFFVDLDNIEDITLET